MAGEGQVHGCLRVQLGGGQVGQPGVIAGDEQLDLGAAGDDPFRALLGQPPDDLQAAVTDSNFNASANRRYLKSALGVSDVALRAFELRGGRVILSGVYDAPEAM